MFPGTKNLIELHGSLYRTRCEKCRETKENYESPICDALRGKGAPDPGTPDVKIPVEQLPKYVRINVCHVMCLFFKQKRNEIAMVLLLALSILELPEIRSTFYSFDVPPFQVYFLRRPASTWYSLVRRKLRGQSPWRRLQRVGHVRLVSRGRHLFHRLSCGHVCTPSCRLGPGSRRVQHGVDPGNGPVRVSLSRALRLHFAASHCLKTAKLYVKHLKMSWHCADI